MVGLYFIPNPNNLPYIKHKDGNKVNNYVENLEWCAVKESDDYAKEVELKQQEKPVKAVNIITKEEICFKSVSEAGAFLGINKGTILKVLNKKRNQTHNYYFEFL